MTRWVSRGLPLSTAVIAIASLSACASAQQATTATSASASVATTSPAAEPSPSSTASASAQPIPLSQLQAKDAFLAAICPSTTTLRVLENIQIEAGGWKAVKPAVARPYIQAAITESRKAARQLTLPTVAWPTDVQDGVKRTAQNLLDFLVPLGQMAKAPDGTSMAAPWKQVSLDPRSAEQGVRLALGLPAANAPKDGCPLIPLATPKPTPTPTPTKAESSGGSGSSNPYSQSYAEESREYICLTGSSSLPELSEGSEGSGVRRLQWALSQLGYDPGPLDGDFGPQTSTAVINFQYYSGIYVDGQVGPQTWRTLKSRLC